MRWQYAPNRFTDIKISNYLINWEKDCASKEQTRVKNFLRPFWKGHLVGCEVVLPKSGKLRVDFINFTKRIALEHNGKGAHDEYNPFFHRNSRANFLSSIKRDVKKEEILKLNNYHFVVTETKDIDNLSLEWFQENYGVFLV